MAWTALFEAALGAEDSCRVFYLSMILNVPFVWNKFLFFLYPCWDAIESYACYVHQNHRMMHSTCCEYRKPYFSLAGSSVWFEFGFPLWRKMYWKQWLCFDRWRSVCKISIYRHRNDLHSCLNCRNCFCYSRWSSTHAALLCQCPYLRQWVYNANLLLCQKCGLLFAAAVRPLNHVCTHAQRHQRKII